jgi:hypothetical protein
LKKGSIFVGAVRYGQSREKILDSVRLFAIDGETLRKLHVYLNICAIKVAKVNNFGLSDFTKYGSYLVKNCVYKFRDEANFSILSRLDGVYSKKVTLFMCLIKHHAIKAYEGVEV